MGMIATLKDMLVPDNEPGVMLECTNCGERFEDPYDTCPNCGSSDMKEVEGFDMAPDT